MADEPKPNVELEAMALEIYTKMPSIKRDGEQEAIASFRRAAAFLKVRGQVRKGELKATVTAPEGPQLCDVCAPRLKRTHPHNLVSQQMGNLTKVSEINKWLTANPTPETDPEDLVARMGQKFPDLDWDLPTINTARVIFPQYVAAGN